MKPTREEFLARRKSGLGGSDAAAVLGYSPWRTPLDIWLDKTGRNGEQEETESMRIGTALEQFVAERYTEDTGNPVQRFNTMLRDGCLVGNIDRLVITDPDHAPSHMGEVRTDRILECKTSSAMKWDDDIVPVYYQIQVQHYMGLAPSVKSCDVACLFFGGGKSFKVFNVPRNDLFIAKMQETLKAWWEAHVVADVPPEPINSEDCRILYGKDDGNSIGMTPDIFDTISEIRTIRNGIKELEDKQEKLEVKVKAYMGANERIVDGNGKSIVTWKTSEGRNTVDYPAFLKSRGIDPKEAREFVKVSAPSRRFVVK